MADPIGSVLGGVLGASNPVMAGLSIGGGIVESIIGAINEGKAKKRQQVLLSQRKAYKTPSDIYDIVNATQFNASSGLSSKTLDYLTNKLDETTSASIDAITRMGNDPNLLSSIFQQGAGELDKIGAMDIEQQTKNFSMFLNAKSDLAANKAAEQKSREDILKDKLAAEGINRSTANQNISSGLNLAISGAALAATDKLYDDPNDDPKKKVIEEDIFGVRPEH